MKQFLMILMICLVSVNSLAQTTVPLNKNDTAPFSGVLFDNKTAQEARNALIIVPSLEKSLQLQTENFTLSEDKVNLLLKQNDNLAKRLGEEREVKSWERVLWFSLGIAASGFAVYGARRLQE